MDQLASANLKLARALEHYTAFNEKLTAFQEANPYVTYRESDPYSGFRILKLRVVGRPQPDPRWGAIVGDFASNLRGALDHLVWAMSVTPRKPRRVEFPIEETHDLFQSRKQFAIGAIPPGAQDIIERLQPYQQWGHLGEKAIWRIKCLANADKHRTVAVVASGLHYQFGSALPGPSGTFISFADNPQTDPVIPDPHQGSARRPWLQTSSPFITRPTFAVVTTDGLHVPVEHLLGLYEFVGTEVFPLFPEHFFPAP